MSSLCPRDRWLRPYRRHDLDLNVAGIFQELLKIDGAITKKGFGFGLRDMNGFEQSGLVVHDLHATRHRQPLLL